MNYYVGRIFPTNGGIDCLVIDYNSAKDVVVQFTDDYKYETKVTISNLLKGNGHIMGYRDYLKLETFGV